MKLEIIKSPFDAHDNLLFKFIKLYLKDGNVYDKSNEAMPYIAKSKKYKIRLSDCYELVKIKLNELDYLSFDGSTSSTGIYEFYVQLGLYVNILQVTDSTGITLYDSLQINCYKMHSFLAFVAKKYKEVWNNLYQAQQNIYLEQGLIDDMDGTALNTEYNFIKNFATLLGTKRYSKFTTAQYISFLQTLVDINKKGSLYEGIYLIQQAIPQYVEKIDIVALEKELVSRNVLSKKVFKSTNNTIKVYPSYIYRNGWEVLPYYDGTIGKTLNLISNWDSTSVSLQLNCDTTSEFSDWLRYIYTDGERYTDSTNIGALKIKGISTPILGKIEALYTDVFTGSEIFTDSSGYYTGFEGSKYVSLRKPSVDGTVYSIVTVGDVIVNNSTRYIEKYNLLDLGTVYDDFTSLSVTYKSFDNFDILGKLKYDSTTGYITNIFKSGHLDIDNYYLDYREENFGAVVINIYTHRGLDVELKNIIQELIRNIIPVHIKYYLNFIVPNLWYWWGENTLTLEQIENYSEYIDDTLTWVVPTNSFNENQNGIWMLTTSGVSIGDAGEYSITTDSGTNWTTTSLGSENLNKIFFNTYGYIVGNAGTIYRTIDSGTNWVAMTSGVSTNLLGFSSQYRSDIKQYICWIVGENGTILLSYDSGVTWNNFKFFENFKNIKTKLTISGVDSGIPGEGKIDGEYTVKQIIDNVVTLNLIEPVDLGSVDLTDAIVTYGDKINNIPITISAITYDNSNMKLYITLNTAQPFTAISFVDYKQGMIVGESGIILLTSDGLTWEQLASETTIDFYDVAYKNASEAVVVGDGEIWYSNSINKTVYISVPIPIGTGNDNIGGGISGTRNSYIIERNKWRKANISDSQILYKVKFLSANNGYVIGGHGSLMKTLDGGVNWSSIISETTDNLNGLCIMSDKKMLVAGDNAYVGMITTSDNLFYKEITWNDLI